ncbi:MAG: DUF6629 family protein [Sphingobacteriales bacterium]
MCFSAGASFGAGAILSIVGVAAIKQSHPVSQRVFAAIPLLFAVQQVSEGSVWLALLNPAHAFWLGPAMYFFLTFAYVLWPAWVPLSILLLEKNSFRRKILYTGLGTGLAVSAYLGYRLLTEDIHAAINGMHIYYYMGPPVALMHYFGVLYFASTVIPCFLSTVKRMWLFGVSIAVSYFITKLFFDDYELSVWCFFAAIMSAAVFSIILDLKKYFLNAISPGDAEKIRVSV